MADARAFGQEQRAVALRMAAALAVAIVVTGAALLADRAAPPVPFVERLQHALRIDLFVIGWLVVEIANVARLRFFSSDDIAGSSAGSASAPVRQAGAILQNTLEQAVLALVAHGIVAASFDRSTALIATLAGLFGVGRLSFRTGYARGARGRAFGFALTFYPSVLALAGSAVVMLSG